LAGLPAGFPGIAAGAVAGVFINSIVAHLVLERKYSKMIESGCWSLPEEEPFPGALYVCALAVFLFHEHAVAVRYVRVYFGNKNSAAWNLFCSAAVHTTGVSSDLLVESLAAALLHADNLDQIPVHQIFSLLEAGEYSETSREHDSTPSEYLAQLLHYSYIHSELEEAYRILGVPFNAPLSIVKKAHRQLANKYHPDRSAASEYGQFQKIQKAYECICSHRS
jgi:hypothetical protein